MNPATVEEIFCRLDAVMPDPKTELAYTNPFTLLVAVVLSAQATDAGVNKATPALFAVADTPEKMAALGEQGLLPYVRTIGLFNTKAKNVIALSRQLLEQHGGEVPRTREELQALPGVGRKTANVVLNVVFGQPTIAVDTHVARVSNRLGLTTAPRPDAIEADLEAIIPQRYLMHAHHLLILHGRYVCKARRPDCPLCPVREQCEYPAKTDSATLVEEGRTPPEPEEG